MKPIVVVFVALSGIATHVPAQVQPSGSAVAAPAPASVPAASAAPSTAARQQRNQVHPRQRKAFQQPPNAQQQQTPSRRQQVTRQQQQADEIQQQPSGSTPAVTRRQHRSGKNQAHQPAINYTQAVHHQHHDRHGRGWWESHYRTIVFVTNCGYYYWDAGYWFPALGYYPQYENFEYNGPIYTYGNLLPDQVIYNVQRALKELGYYDGPL